MINEYYIIIRTKEELSKHSYIKEVVTDFIHGLGLSNVKIISNYGGYYVFFYKSNISIEDEVRELYISLKSDISSEFIMLYLDNYNLNDGLIFLRNNAFLSVHGFITNKDILRFYCLSGNRVDKQLIRQILGKYYNNREMLLTIKIFIEDDLNVSEAARTLYLHRNSLIQRLDKFHLETKFDVKKFKEAFIIYCLICEVLDIRM